MAKRIKLDKFDLLYDKSKLSKPSKPDKLDKTVKTDKPSWIHFAFKARPDQIEKMKDVAYWDRKKIKIVFEEAMELYLKDRKIRPRLKE